MKSWFLLAFSLAAAVWLFPDLWKSFRAGIVSSAFPYRRDEYPGLYWLVFAIQTCLVIVWVGSTIMLVIAMINGEVPN
jgi:hypothetical protein